MLTEDQTTTAAQLQKATEYAVNHKTVNDIPNREQITASINTDISKGIYKSFPVLEKKLIDLVHTLSVVKNELSFADYLVLAENEYI